MTRGSKFPPAESLRYDSEVARNRGHFLLAITSDCSRQQQLTMNFPSTLGVGGGGVPQGPAGMDPNVKAVRVPLFRLRRGPMS